MKQSLIKNGLTFKTLGNGKKNNVINENIAHELNDCTISSIANYYKKKKMKSIQNSQKCNNNQQPEIGPKASFITKNDKYVIVINLNGITKNNIKLDLVGSYFIISCQKTKNILNGNKNNKFCYFKKTFKLPNDSVPESMKAKLYEERLEVIIGRENDGKTKKENESLSKQVTETTPDAEEAKENIINDISKMDQPNIDYKEKGTSMKDKNNEMDIYEENYDTLEIKKGKIKRKSTSSVYNRQPSSKNLRKYTSDTNLFYYNNKNKILCMGSSSFSHKKEEPSKINKLELSSFIPPRILQNKSKSDYELINQRKKSIEDSENVHDSGWILVTRRRHRKKDSFSSKDTPFRNKPQNLIITSSDDNQAKRTSSTHKLHYKDPNNIYSHLYVSSDSSMSSSSSSINTLSSRSVSSNIDNKNQAIKNTNNNISKPNINVRKISFSSKTNINSSGINKKDSKSNINDAKILSKNISESSIGNRRSLSKNISESSIGNRRSLSKNISESSIGNKRKLSKNISESSIGNKRKLSKNISESSIGNRRSLSKNISESSIGNRRSLSKNISESSIGNRRSLSKNISESNIDKKKNNINMSRPNSYNRKIGDTISRTDPKDRKIGNSENTEKPKKSVHQMVFERLSSSNKINQKEESNKKSNESSSNISGLRKNMHPTPLMIQSKSNSFNQNIFSGKNNKNSSKTFLYSENPTKPSWNHSSSTYDSIKAKVLDSLNEVYRKPHSTVKGSSSTYKMSKPISNVQAKVDTNKKLSIRTNSLNKKSSLNSPSAVYSAMRKKSLIPSSPTTNCTSPISKPLLKIVTNDGISSFKKSRIPYSPQSKVTLEKIDNFITNSLNKMKLSC